MTRFVSAAVLIAVLIATLWWAPPWATVVLAAIAAGVAAVELAHISRAAGADVSVAFLGSTASVVCVAFALRASWPAAGDDLLATVLLAGVVACGAVTLASGPPAASTVARAGVTYMGPLYIGLPLGALAAMRVSSGPASVGWLVLIVAVSDSAQYYTGRLLGRTRLAPAVSPAKTVEGAIGGLVAATLVGAIAGPRIAVGVPLTAIGGAGLALFVAAFGIIGDLFESLLKRSAGVKDSSSIIPGHGGVLDRIDSYLFAAPCYYLILRWLA